jgi:hypothetical protein
MERFAPDTWRDALWRPISMGAPDAGVYMEIMAPDIRFACLALLTVAVVVLAVLLRRKLVSRPAGLLLLFTWLAFVPWLATTGNGRYFIPVLLLAGPLCIGLIRSLPITGGAQLALAALVVALQGFVVVQNDPRGWWGLSPWGERYFSMELTDEDRNVPATYVTISLITHSLIAPQFDHRSRWIGLSRVPSGPQTLDGERAQRRLMQAHQEGLPLKLLVPTIPDRVDAQMQPDAPMRDEINRLLGPHRLALETTARCELRRSATMAARMFDKPQEHSPVVVQKIGFWICPLAFPVELRAPAVPRAPVAPELLARAERVFDVLAHQCPRVFGSGAPPAGSDGGGIERQYADIKVYVTADGKVYFRYWRALNSNYVGTSEEVLAPGFSMDCNRIKGRSGLPWEREI